MEVSIEGVPGAEGLRYIAGGAAESLVKFLLQNNSP